MGKRELLKELKKRDCTHYHVKVTIPRECPKGNCPGAVAMVHAKMRGTFGGATITDQHGTWKERGRKYVDPVSTIHSAVDNSCRGEKKLGSLADTIVKAKKKAKQKSIFVSFKEGRGVFV